MQKFAVTNDDGWLILEEVVLHPDGQIGEVDATDHQAERRRENIVDQRLNDASKSGANDDADRQVQDIALQSESN